jgi:hypothetical protein
VVPSSRDGGGRCTSSRRPRCCEYSRTHALIAAARTHERVRRPQCNPPGHPDTHAPSAHSLFHPPAWNAQPAAEDTRPLPSIEPAVRRRSAPAAAAYSMCHVRCGRGDTPASASLGWRPWCPCAPRSWPRGAAPRPGAPPRPEHRPQKTVARGVFACGQLSERVCGQLSERVGGQLSAPDGLCSPRSLPRPPAARGRQGAGPRCCHPPR